MRQILNDLDPFSLPPCPQEQAAMVRRRDGGDQLAAFLKGGGSNVRHAMLRHNHIDIAISRGYAVAVRNDPAGTARCARCQRQNRQSASRGPCDA